jgi:hypothetical protein
VNIEQPEGNAPSQVSPEAGFEVHVFCTGVSIDVVKSAVKPLVDREGWVNIAIAMEIPLPRRHALRIRITILKFLFMISPFDEFPLSCPPRIYRSFLQVK